MEKKHSEKGKASLDLTRPKLNRNTIVYHETGDLFADNVKSWRAHKVLRMRLSIQFWFKGTGYWGNELL